MNAIKEFLRPLLHRPERDRAMIATIVGMVGVGGFAVVFAKYCEWATIGFRHVINHSPLWLIIFTPLTFVLSAMLIRQFFPGASGSGIPKVMHALHHSPEVMKGSISIKISIGKILSVGLALLGGASIGREGPTVQIGAGIMAYIGKKLKLSEVYLKNLVLAGGAGGLAAAFNTPIAGVVFAVEELSHSFYRRMHNFSFLGVILAGIIAQILLGDHPYFQVYLSQTDAAQEIIPALTVGIIGGLLGGLFSYTLLKGIKYIRTHYAKKLLTVAITMGLVVALVGIVIDRMSLGTGYMAAAANLDNAPLSYPLLFVVAKFITTIASYLSGIAGGIFAPTLAIGSGIGASLNNVFSAFHGAHTPILGMAAFFAGVVQAPMTAFIIVFEMTSASRLVLPLMISSFLGYSISYLITKKSLYDSLAEMHNPDEQH